MRQVVRDWLVEILGGQVIQVAQCAQSCTGGLSYPDRNTNPNPST